MPRSAAAGRAHVPLGTVVSGLKPFALGPTKTSNPSVLAADASVPMKSSNPSGFTAGASVPAKTSDPLLFSGSAGSSATAASVVGCCSAAEVSAGEGWVSEAASSASANDACFTACVGTSGRLSGLSSSGSLHTDMKLSSRATGGTRNATASFEAGASGSCISSHSSLSTKSPSSSLWAPSTSRVSSFTRSSMAFMAARLWAACNRARWRSSSPLTSSCRAAAISAV
mmetsp:Transcript_6723/g.18804  ORF Transcript_6723/g.18804 Transcript_6723/m.18804 type:complete len:227 (+) Transcript_6723:762-1442(+)